MTEDRQDRPEPDDDRGAGGPLSTHDRELIDRYLAEQLSGDDLTTVETRIVMDPAFRREVETTEALRAGLALLDAASGIQPLLAASGSPIRRLTLADRLVALWSRPSFALAASIATVGLGVLALVLYGQLQSERQLNTGLSARVPVQTFAPAQRRTALSFATLRSASDPVTVRVSGDPEQYEMTFDVGAEPADEYAVAILKPATAGNAVLFEAPHIAPGTDGLVRLSVHSAVLVPGDYLVVLIPQARGGESGPHSEAAGMIYELRVVR